MSSAETKQGQQAVNFVVPDQGLRNRSAFEAITPSAPFSARMSGRSTPKAHLSARNNHIFQQESTAELTIMAIGLTNRTFLYSVIDLIQTGQMAMAMASTIQDPELRAFIEDYIRQGLNYSTNTHAGYIETMRVKLNEHIQANVEPGFWDGWKAFFGLV